MITVVVVEFIESRGNVLFRINIDGGETRVLELEIGAEGVELGRGGLGHTIKDVDKGTLGNIVGSSKSLDHRLEPGGGKFDVFVLDVSNGELCDDVGQSELGLVRVVTDLVEGKLDESSCTLLIGGKIVVILEHFVMEVIGESRHEPVTEPGGRDLVFIRKM